MNSATFNFLSQELEAQVAIKNIADAKIKAIEDIFFQYNPILDHPLPLINNEFIDSFSSELSPFQAIPTDWADVTDYGLHSYQFERI